MTSVLEELLDSYQAERAPVARDVFAPSHRLVRLARSQPHNAPNEQKSAAVAAAPREFLLAAPLSGRPSTHGEYAPGRGEPASPDRTRYLTS